MISFTRFILSSLLNKYRNPKLYYSSAFYRGFHFYNSIKDTQKKSYLTVLEEVRSLYIYWGGVFPDSYFRFGMFLMDYTERERVYSFVPQGAYNKYAMDNDLRYHVLIDDKILFHDIMTHYGFPVPQRFFVYRNNEFRSGSQLLTDEQVDNIISSVNDERIFVKRFTGGAASGISIFKRGENGKYYTEEGDLVSASLVRSKFKNQDYIFEKQLQQDEVLKQYNPDTVNTIRVLTYKNKVISAVVRFGGKGSFVDNTAKGGVAVSLDIETGILGDYGMREYDLTHYLEHPDSHLKFKGVHVPQWNDAKMLVEKVCQYMPYYNSVGFDVATTVNGPVIIEINTGSGIYLSQMGKEIGLSFFFKN